MPAVFLLVLGLAVGPLAAHVALEAAVAMAAVLVGARRRAPSETYTLSDRFVSVEQPGGGRVAIPTETLDPFRARLSAGVQSISSPMPASSCGQGRPG